jgi:hypothetical protein
MKNVPGLLLHFFVGCSSTDPQGTELDNIFLTTTPSNNFSKLMSEIQQVQAPLSSRKLDPKQSIQEIINVLRRLAKIPVNTTSSDYEGRWWL